MNKTEFTIFTLLALIVALNTFSMGLSVGRDEIKKSILSGKCKIVNQEVYYR